MFFRVYLSLSCGGGRASEPVSSRCGLTGPRAARRSRCGLLSGWSLGDGPTYSACPNPRSHERTRRSRGGRRRSSRRVGSRNSSRQLCCPRFHALRMFYHAPLVMELFPTALYRLPARQENSAQPLHDQPLPSLDPTCGCDCGAAGTAGTPPRRATLWPRGRMRSVAPPPLRRVQPHCPSALAGYSCFVWCLL